MIRNLPPFADYLLLISLGALWGSAFIFVKIAGDEMTPLIQTAYRLIVAVILLWALLLLSRKWVKIDIKTMAWIFVCGVLGVAAPFYLIAWGQQEVSPGLTAVLMAIMPLITLLLAHFATHDEKFTVLKGVGLVLGFIGVVILMGPESLTGANSALIFQIAILGGATCYAINAVLLKRLSHLPTLVLSTGTITSGFLVTVPSAFFLEAPFHLDYSWNAFTAVFLLAALHLVFAAFILIFLIKRRGATFFSQINLLVPLFGVLWAFLIFSEQPSINATFALVLILSGIVIARGDLKPVKTGP